MTREQIETLITDNITTNSNGEITAVKVKTILDAIANDYRHSTDEITLSQVTDLVSSLAGKQATLTATNIKTIVDSLVEMTTPINADNIIVTDSAGTTAKKLSWTNIKAFLKTYFDTLYQVILVSGTNIKTINGSSILGSGDLVISSGGVFGISNSSGIYTYYSTLTLAMASATAGQTIEMFADYTETGAVTITFIPGVVLQGNGHTYKHTHASATHTFKFNQSDKYQVKNLYIERTNATGGAVLWSTADLYGGQPAVSVFIFGESLTIKTSRYGSSCSGNTIFDVVGVDFILTGSGQIYNSTLKKCSVSSDSATTVTVVQNSTIHNSTVYHLGSAVALSQVNAYNSTCLSISSGVCNEMLEVIGCFFSTGSGVCVGASGMSPKYSNCIFISSTSFAMQQNSGYCEVNNCTLKTYANHCTSVNNVMFNGCRFIAYGSAVATAGNSYFSNCSFYCYYNNSAGHCLMNTVSAMNFITNCDFRVTNASANCLNASSSTSVKYSNNNFVGATTPINANVTQGISNTHDSQGNILI